MPLKKFEDYMKDVLAKNPDWREPEEGIETPEEKPEEEPEEEPEETEETSPGKFRTLKDFLSDKK